MKKMSISKILFLIIIAGLLLSCKKNDVNIGDSNGIDSTEMTVDTVGPTTDTINDNLESGTGTGANGAGTTGATGEGSTGSGSAGTTQKGNASVRTDSISSGNGK